MSWESGRIRAAQEIKLQYDGIDMARSVSITTPIPTLEETAERYGLSKADRKFVASLFDAQNSRRPGAHKRKAKAGVINISTATATRVAGRAGKTNGRARKTA